MGEFRSGRSGAPPGAGAVKPCPDLLVGCFWKVNKTNAGSSVSIRPRDLTFYFHLVFVAGELQTNVHALIHFDATRHLYSDPADADIDNHSLNFVAPIETDADRAMQTPAEMSAMLGEHQALGSLQAVQRALQREWRIKSEVRTHVEGIAHRPGPIEDDANNHFVMRELAHAGNELGSTAGICVDDDGLKLLLGGQLQRCVKIAAYVGVDLQMRKSSLQRAHGLGITANDERLQSHTADISLR